MKACPPILALVLTLGVSHLEAQILTGPVNNPANGHDYYLTVQSTWTAAESTALGLGGHLTTINDAAEDAWVYSTFSLLEGQPINLWIGLVDGGVRWIDDDPSGYRNFAPGEPNFGDAYVYIIAPGIGASGEWNNSPDVDSMNYSAQGGGSLPFLPIHGVIEVIPEPSMLALAGLGAGALMVARRRRIIPRQRRIVADGGAASIER